MIALIALIALIASCNTYGAVGVGGGGTFVVAVSGETFRVRIDNALLANKARRIMNGFEGQKVVNGELATGDGGFNSGYHWHIKPNTVDFADATIELCDGRPSDIEGNLNYWIDTVKRYCPWSGRITSEIGKL